MPIHSLYCYTSITPHSILSVLFHPSSNLSYFSTPIPNNRPYPFRQSPYPSAKALSPTIPPIPYFPQDPPPTIHPTQHSIYLPFLFPASLFLNGNPLILLSAPVLRLMRPLLLANIIHQNATAARNMLPRVPKLKLMTPVSVHSV